MSYKRHLFNCFLLQVTAPAFQALPSSVAAASLGLTADAYSDLKNQLPKPAFIPNSDPECVARCLSLGISVAAPAPSMIPAVATGGR